MSSSLAMQWWEDNEGDNVELLLISSNSTSIINVLHFYLHVNVFLLISCLPVFYFLFFPCFLSISKSICPSYIVLSFTYFVHFFFFGLLTKLFILKHFGCFALILFILAIRIFFPFSCLVISSIFYLLIYLTLFVCLPSFFQFFLILFFFILFFLLSV